MKTFRTINFKDTKEDLNTLEDVCRELEARGLTPEAAAANVLAQMVSEALKNGIDNKEVMDALFVVMNSTKQDNQPHTPRKGAISESKANEIKAQVKFYQNLLLYWDMILCTEIQRLAYQVKDELVEQGLFRHDFKKYANALINEARILQMRIKDNNRAVVIKWCRSIDRRQVFVRNFPEDGGDIASKFVLAFAEKFHKTWEVVRLDCRTTAKLLSEKQSKLVSVLLEIEAFTNTGAELFDSCVKRMKRLVAGHGTASITKSTHHEAMRNAAHNLLRKMGKASSEVPETNIRYAREHLASMQCMMISEGMGDFFQEEFDDLSKEFIIYMIARMWMDLNESKLGIGAIRTVWERLGKRSDVSSFFKELEAMPAPEDETDVIDVAKSVEVYLKKHKLKKLRRFKDMCEKGEWSPVNETDELTEARLLRQQARRNKGLLPIEMIVVMAKHYKTKKALVEHLSSIGFELKPTLDKVKKMKASELKQIA